MILKLHYCGHCQARVEPDSRCCHQCHKTLRPDTAPGTIDHRLMLIAVTLGTFAGITIAAAWQAAQ